MKKLFFASILAMLLASSVFAQSNTLDQHNWTIALQDSFVIVGAVADTSAIFRTGYFSHAAIWAEYDSVAASDSGHGHIILEGSMFNDSTAKYWQAAAYDTSICSTAVASLPAVHFEDYSATLTDMPYARLRTVATTGNNDSTRFVIRVFLREN